MSEFIEYIIDNKNICVPRTIFSNRNEFPAPLKFNQLAFLYSRYEHPISFINFLFKYECAHILFLNKKADLIIPNDVFYDEQNDRDELELKQIEFWQGFFQSSSGETKGDDFWRLKVQNDNTVFQDYKGRDNLSNSLDENVPEYDMRQLFNLFSDIIPLFAGTENKIILIREVRVKYIQIISTLNDQNEEVPMPMPIPGDVDNDYGSYLRPQLADLRKVQKFPSLWEYSLRAHKYLIPDNDIFTEEFLSTYSMCCIETIDARHGKYYIDNQTASEPINFLSTNSIPIARSIGGKGIDRIKNWMQLFTKHPNIHIITRSVEPLVAALRAAWYVGCSPTIEFEGQDLTIQVMELYNHITAYVSGDELTEMLTFIVLLLVGSSSGIPLYASRCWYVVQNVWNRITKNKKRNIWLARQRNKNIEINEKLLLELIIRVLAITHVSEDINDPLRSFQPGLSTYVQYAERYYEKMKQNLGYVQTTNTSTSLEETNTSTNLGETKSTGQNATRAARQNATRFAYRMRFREEFSFPASMNHFRQTFVCRLSHFLCIPDVSKIVFK